MNDVAAPADDQSLAGRSGREIEVKLEGPPGVLAAVFAHEALAGIVARPRAQRLVTTYFDTPDDALERAGMALRVRRNGARLVLTLKWIPEGAAGSEGLFSRGEAEAKLPGEPADVLGAVGRLGLACELMVREALGEGALAPRFETRVKRRIGTLALAGGGAVEVALDEGEIVAGDRRMPLHECELELKGGSPAGLFNLAARLTDAGLWISPEAKSARGYRLARDERPATVRAIHPSLAPGATGEDMAGAVVDATLRQFLGNWPALRDSRAPESVHQIRVALRRLRSGLALFERAWPGGGFEPFRAEAKRIASALGPARELDVFQSLVEDGPLTALPRDASFDALLGAAAARQADAYGRARDLMDDPATSRFVLHLQAFVASRGWRNGLSAPDLAQLGESARRFGCEALDRLDRRARKRGKGLVDLAPEQRHDVRIALKNLRYAGDFCACLFDDSRGAKRFAQTVGALQDALGAYNDSVVAQQTIAALEEDAGPAAARAAGAVLGWCAHGARKADDDLGAAWRAYRKARRFWR
ncbi:MAG: hypothetical protein JWN93_1873 [Hyphomicrobiales bacterium]|nr:hypothetical protein [Hyphomicrobiales bacterium]